MAKLQVGDTVPQFRYDTPYHPQNSFYELTSVEKPLFLIFLSNMGHPVTRAYLLRYAETVADLESCRLACVVRSRPEIISAALPEGTMPFTLICDAEGVLYEHFSIPQSTDVMRYQSLEAGRIFREARKNGYQLDKNIPQQLPLTLVVDVGGVVLFEHYGQSLTDLPEDCTAMERTLAQLRAIREQNRKAAAKKASHTPFWQRLFGKKQEEPDRDDSDVRTYVPANSHTPYGGVERQPQSQWEDRTDEIAGDKVYAAMEQRRRAAEEARPVWDITGEMERQRARRAVTDPLEDEDDTPLWTKPAAGSRKAPAAQPDFHDQTVDLKALGFEETKL